MSARRNQKQAGARNPLKTGYLQLKLVDSMAWYSIGFTTADFISLVHAGWGGGGTRKSAFPPRVEYNLTPRIRVVISLRRPLGHVGHESL
jgi:hypothetical protein